MTGRLCTTCGHTDAMCECSEGPTWGRKHTHKFEPTTTIGDLTIERCSCGQVRHVIIVPQDGAS